MSQAIPNVVEQVDSAFWIILGISGVLFVGIILALVAFLMKYHKSRHPKATSQVEGHAVLEVLWIVIPTLIVLFMFWIGVIGFKSMRTVPDGAMVVKLTAQRWSFNFQYPQGDVSSPVLHVPAGVPVKVELNAPVSDVIHGFYLPDFRVKEDVIPGKQTYLWFMAPKEGTYNIFCTMFCGNGHSEMITTLQVHSKEGYEEWIRQQIADKNKPVDMALAMDPRSKDIQARGGRKLYDTYCASCHGAQGDGKGLAGARDFRSLAGWKNGEKLTDIFRTVTVGLDGTAMRGFPNLSAWDRFALVHEVAAFYKGGDRPASSPEDIEQLRAEYKLDEVPVVAKTLSIEKAMELIVKESQQPR